MTKDKITNTTITIDNGTVTSSSSNSFQYHINIRDTALYVAAAVATDNKWNLAARIGVKILESTQQGGGPTIHLPPIPEPVDETITDGLEKVSIMKDVLDAFDIFGGK